MKYKTFIAVILMISFTSSLAFSQQPSQIPTSQNKVINSLPQSDNASLLKQEPQSDNANSRNKDTDKNTNENTETKSIKQEAKLALEPITPIESEDVSIATKKVNWQAPTPRAKNKGPYGPIPWDGVNIFKGDAGQWLAETIEQIQLPEEVRIKSPQLESYVNQLGNFLGAYSIVPNTKLQFIITNSESPNATSISGGKIVVSIGLLRIVETEDELAGVLAHEIAHDTYSHVQRTLTRQLFWLARVRKVNSRQEVEEALDKLVLAYEKNKFATTIEKLTGISRFDELKADQQAFYTTYRAGYNPRAIVNVLKRIEEENKTVGTLKNVKKFILGTHPLTSYRSFSLDWEAGFVKLPPKDSAYESTAFKNMKAELEKIDKTE